MSDLFELLYERYNQFGYYEYPIQNPYTLIRILREGNIVKNNLEEKIHEYEILERFSETNADYQELVEDKNFVQPKSVVIRIHYLELILNSLPDFFFEDLAISRAEILQISVSIVMYYMGLNVYKYGEVPISDSVKRIIIGRDDCYFGLKEIQMVCGKIGESSYNRYLEIFARDINEISERDSVRLYKCNEKSFILCMADFLDYVMHEIEKMFKKQYSEQEFSRYMNAKGRAFEELVYGFLKSFYNECYHNLYYYPGGKRNVELDIVFRENEKIAVIECKSRTIWFEEAINDADIKGTIRYGIDGAYKSLCRVADYCAANKGYCFENSETKISGKDEIPLCIHVSMYPLDFISSNIHTLFPKFMENKSNPILTISLEHLCAILLDLREKNESIFDYWEKRKADIAKYPNVQFDNNELDLYHTVMMQNRRSILSELKESGILDAVASNVSIMTSFRDGTGNEERPALFMLRYLDFVLGANIFLYGKSWLGLNKRYLKNLEEIIKIVEE